MTFDKNLLLGLAAGVAVGVIGAKYYTEHKDEIDEKIKGLAGSNLFNKTEKEDDTELTLEELETQKERLEDLIAELKSKQENA